MAVISAPPDTLSTADRVVVATPELLVAAVVGVNSPSNGSVLKAITAPCMATPAASRKVAVIVEVTPVEIKVVESVIVRTVEPLAPPPPPASGVPLLQPARTAKTIANHSDREKFDIFWENNEKFCTRVSLKFRPWTQPMFRYCRNGTTIFI